MSLPVLEALAHILIQSPEMATHHVVKALRESGASGLSAKALEALLRKTDGFIGEDAGGRTYWSYDEATDPLHVMRQGAVHQYADALAPPPTIGDVLDALALRDWQIEAFGAWAAHESRGVVEAVTGTGKTRLAMAACAACLGHAGRVLVIVPTLELMSQWQRQLREFFGEVRIGQLGGGSSDDFSDHHIVIATPHSAAAVPITPPGLGLLIADEAHRYGAPTWVEALRPDYAMRLALTATYERNDEGVEELLAPYFGDVVYSYGYREAARDQVIAPFSIAFVPVSLTKEERALYGASDSAAKETRNQLMAAGFPKNPLKLIEYAAKLTAKHASTPAKQLPFEAQLARQYLTVLQKRRAVAARAANKYETILPLIDRHPDTKILIFTDTIDQADKVVDICLSHGHKAFVIASDLSSQERRQRLGALRKGSVNILVAPRVLDEGIDVPDCQVAIVLAAFRTRRQMIQRLGRVLRLKPDGASAQLYIVYAQETREDPKQGAQREFLQEVVDVAEVVETLPCMDPPEE